MELKDDLRVLAHRDGLDIDLSTRTPLRPTGA
jgi:hypothetical protein